MALISLVLFLFLQVESEAKSNPAYLDDSVPNIAVVDQTIVIKADGTENIQRFGEIELSKGDNLKLAFLVLFPFACFVVGVVVTGAYA